MGKQRQVKLDKETEIIQDTLNEAIKIFEANPLRMAQHEWFTNYVEPHIALRLWRTGRKISKSKKRKEGRPTK